MSRPTTTEVDEALETVRRKREMLDDEEGGVLSHHEKVLQVEVVALRNELAYAKLLSGSVSQTIREVAEQLTAAAEVLP